MLLHLISWLEGFSHIPAAFTYTSSRMILAWLCAFILTLFLGPNFIRKLFELKVGQPIREMDGFLLSELHKNKKNTPTMGGILILTVMICSLLLWMNLAHPFTWILLITTVLLGSVGAYDDFLKLKYKSSKGLSAKGKLLCQLSVALLTISYFYLTDLPTALGKEEWKSSPVIKEFISKRNNEKTLSNSSSNHIHASSKYLSLREYLSRIYMPFFKEPIIIVSGCGLLISWLLAAFVIVGSSNAVNLTDGLDGLASGCIIFVAASLAIVGFLMNNQDMAEYLNIVYVEGSSEVAIFLSSLCGACLGFLWFNCHPAQVFMGDTGSLTLGGILGVSAVLLRREFFLALVGAVFVVEALSVILQVLSFRYRNKTRIFKCAPLHHHFEYCGWAENKVVVRFWIVGLLLALIGIVSLKFQ